MATSTCPNCKQPVAAMARFCSFCGATMTFTGTLTPSPGAVVEQPATTGSALAPMPQPGWATYTYKPLLAQEALPFKTTTPRAVAVTMGIVAVAAVAVFALWRLLTHVDYGTNVVVYHFFVDSNRFSSLPADVGLEALVPFTLFTYAFISVAPVAAIGAYWFSLRRLYQESPWVILGKTALLSVLYMALATVEAGALLHSLVGDVSPVVGASAWWSLRMLLVYPAWLLVGGAVAVACAAMGIAFGRVFALWPLERIRDLQSPWALDLLMALGWGLLGMALQYVVYRLVSVSLGMGEPFAAALWWIPGAAIVIGGYAGWSALRPKKMVA